MYSTDQGCAAVSYTHLLIDDANAFMSNLTTARHFADAAVKPQVAAAYARPHHSDDSIGRLLYRWLVNVFACD